MFWGSVSLLILEDFAISWGIYAGDIGKDGQFSPIRLSLSPSRYFARVQFDGNCLFAPSLPSGTEYSGVNSAFFGASNDVFPTADGAVDGAFLSHLSADGATGNATGGAVDGAPILFTGKKNA